MRLLGWGWHRPANFWASRIGDGTDAQGTGLKYVRMIPPASNTPNASLAGSYLSLAPQARTHSCTVSGLVPVRKSSAICSYSPGVPTRKSSPCSEKWRLNCSTLSKPLLFNATQGQDNTIASKHATRSLSERTIEFRLDRPGVLLDVTKDYAPAVLSQNPSDTVE